MSICAYMHVYWVHIHEGEYEDADELVLAFDE